RIRGVELNGWVDITNDLNLSANGTILDGKDMTTGLDLYKTPEHLFNAKLEWQTLDTLSTRVGWNYVGSQIIPVPRKTGTTYERSEGYHTFDLGFVWNAMPQLDVKTGLNNLTNTKRDQVATYADLILEGRTVYAGLEYKL
ncbi:MAG: TonB-dependent receptor domain-containing protein, partial [Aeromonas sp.]|uniref:TonB-dependent receptor domain-containing protein n=1 Tax=Aeromonas sp. TaxID=647 RepID=UPI003D6B7A2B